MIRIGIIGGTRAEIAFETEREHVAETPYGPFCATVATLLGEPDRELLFVRRHGAGHTRLSSSVDHRAHIRGLADAGVSAIVGTTVCGVLEPSLGLGRAILFDDLFFPDNRLPDGSPCTFFSEPEQTGRGHYIFGSPFSPSLRSAALAGAREAGVKVVDGGTYAYSLGPRFNTRSEVAWMRSCGGCAVSQTAGPEAVLAGELEVPYCLIGFGVDYANGVTAEPTPVDVLDANIAQAAPVFARAIAGIVRLWDPVPFDTGFVYRFE